MKYFLTLIIFTTFLFAIQKSDVYKAYKNKQYNDACILGAKIYLQHKKDNDFLTIFADACLKVDNINRMAIPAMLLVRDPTARSNSIYFLTVLYQKKLLYKSLIDGFDVSRYVFPSTDYILSKIFVKYAKKDYKKIDNVYIFKDDKNNDITYRMNVIQENGVYKIILQTYLKNILEKTRIYW